MYLKNLTKQIKFRISEEDFSFLVLSSKMYGISVSQYLRNLIRSARCSSYDGFPVDTYFADSEDVHDGDTTTDKLDIV